MSITGSLTDFSLPEIFQFIERGHKTGLLTLYAESVSQATPSSVYYMWASKGNIVAAANQLNNQGLVLLIDQYPWVSNRVVTKLAQFCPPNKSLGLYLRSQGALHMEQLEHLFQIQVVQQLCTLFQLKDAQFKFDQNVPLPMQEMTGLCVSAEVLKVMLRKLVWLQNLFETRKQQREKSEVASYSENFCYKLRLSLDIAFFHSLNFSLFDTNNSLSELSQIFDLCDRPYDLPKSLKDQAMCCAGK